MKMESLMLKSYTIKIMEIICTSMILHILKEERNNKLSIYSLDEKAGYGD